MNTVRKGREGENHAVDYLKETGYEVIKRNYWSFGAEVDVIASIGKTLVFVEVKRWDAYGFRELGRAMDRKKRRSIARASKGFMYDNPKYDDFAVRYDVIFISATGRVTEHVEEAFTENEQL